MQICITFHTFKTIKQMGYYKNNIAVRSGFFRAIVVRELSTGEKVFHKFRTVAADPRKLERFQRNMYLFEPEGQPKSKLIHINYYYKETGQFSHQWKCNFD